MGTQCPSPNHYQTASGLKMERSANHIRFKPHDSASTSNWRACFKPEILNSKIKQTQVEESVQRDSLLSCGAVSGTEKPRVRGVVLDVSLFCGCFGSSSWKMIYSELFRGFIFPLLILVSQEGSSASVETSVEVLEKAKSQMVRACTNNTTLLAFWVYATCLYCSLFSMRQNLERKNGCESAYRVNMVCYIFLGLVLCTFRIH